jgi:hypothetical protein
MSALQQIPRNGPDQMRQTAVVHLHQIGACATKPRNYRAFSGGRSTKKTYGMVDAIAPGKEPSQQRR